MLVEREFIFEKVVEIVIVIEIVLKNLIDIGGKTFSSDNNVNKVEEEFKFLNF